MIPDISKEFDAGLITVEHVEQLLEEVYGLGDSEEKTDHRQRVIKNGEIVKFQLVALNARAQEALKDQLSLAAADPGTPVPDELLKDVPEPVYDHPRPDMAAEIKRRVGIIAGVRLWGKPQVRISERGTEGIKVRCPFDSHPDHDPSAWVNTEKNTWYCGKCMIGGDVIDFYAAKRYGLSPNDFHKSSEFGNIVREMGEELGIRVQQDTSGDYFVEDDANPLPSAAPDADPEESVAERPTPLDVTELDSTSVWVTPEPTVAPSPEADEPITISEDDMLRGVVIDSYETEDFDIEEQTDTPTLDWMELGIPSDTFLDNWMRVNTDEFYWIPSEYFLMLGMQSLGLACGHSLTAYTYDMVLNGSTMLCLIGHSGLGKTTAVSKQKRMLTNVLGPKWDPSLGTGVKILPAPGSAEALLVSVRHDIEDPNNATEKVEVGITTWLFEDEFASFVARSQRKGGGNIKPRLMLLHDFVKHKDEPELVMADNSLANKLREVHDTFFSGCFLTQPDALSSLTERVDLVSGFLNRFIPVFGIQRERKLASRPSVSDPDPEYHEMYRQLWMRVRWKRDLLPFDAATTQLIDTHPFFVWAEKAVQLSSMYARLTHNTLRFALLLAVNEGSPSVTPAHLEQAVKLGNYLQECLTKLVGDVIRVPEDDCAVKVVKFVRKWFSSKGQWPTKKNWQGDRISYRDFTAVHRAAAMETLFREERLVEVTLVDGSTKTKVFIVPDGPWASYATAHGKTFKSEDVYR